MDNDPDPSPATFFDTHGTQVAGIAAMEKGNGVCGVGVAYHSSLAGTSVREKKWLNVTIWHVAKLIGQRTLICIIG